MKNILVYLKKSVQKSTQGQWVLAHDTFIEESRPLSNEEFEKFKARVHQFDENEENMLHISQEEYNSVFTEKSPDNATIKIKFSTS